MKRNRLFALLSLIMVLSIGCSKGKGSSAPSHVSGSKPVAKYSTWVHGYYVAYHSDRMTPEEIGWEGLTHISVGAITITDASDADNIAPVIDKSFYQGSESDGVDFAKKVSSLAKQNKVIPILMLGGMGNGTDIKNATRPAELHNFVNELIATVEELGFQGIDLDWEDDIDYERFLNLAKALQEKAPELVLTMPIGVINPNYMAADADVIKMAPYLDQINIMSYFDCGTIWYGTGYYSGHSSPLRIDGKNPVSIEDTLKRYADGGVDKKKLGMGLAFYGVGYSGGITQPGQSGITQGMFMGGDNEYMLADLFTSNAYLYALANGCVKWDATAQCTYLSLPAGREDIFGCRYVSFEDERSILAKGQFCRDNGYGGTIVWTIDQGYVKGHSNPFFLMQTLKKAFLDPAYQIEPAVSINPKNIYVKPGNTVQMKVLITGSSNLNISWSAEGGTINSIGLYTAGAAEGSYTVTAVSNGKTAMATVVVSSASWTPSISLFCTREAWKAIWTDPNDGITSIQMEYGGVKYPFIHEGDWNNGVIYSNLTQVPDGGIVKFYVSTSDGRSAKTADFVYRVKGFYDFYVTGTTIDPRVDVIPTSDE